MTAVVPLNVAAIRVSATDQSSVTPAFKGQTAAFDQLPHSPTSREASTGDTIVRPLADNTASQRLGAGVHLHWELPDFFKRGVQSPSGGAVKFPAVPNRWLVTRSLSVADSAGKPGPVQTKSWIVESDYVSPTPAPDPDGKVQRPAVSVPLASGAAPYMFMGRVLDAQAWNPQTEQPSDYLPHYRGPGGAALYLISIGFVGPAFSAYYPDCRSVFGFWDTFADVPELFAAITQNNAVQFTASYQVIGWLADSAADPLAGFAALVRSRYDQHVAESLAERVKVKLTPAEVFVTLAEQMLGWKLRPSAVSYTLKPDQTLDTLQAPSRTLVAGLAQEIEWNQLTPEADTPFLATPSGATSWSDDVELAIGNTTTEAVSALVKSHLKPPGGAGVLGNYETLLDALQLGLLRDLEARGNQLTDLAETLHSSSFSQRSGGHLWTIAQRPDPAAPGQPPTVPAEVTLPLTLAEQLNLLNAAQQAYDQGRARVTELRKQLFMDWVVFVKQYVRGDPAPVVDTNALSAFLATSSGGELGAVKAAGAAVGLARYELDPATNHIVGVRTSDTSDTAARRLVAAFETVKTALGAIKTPAPWALEATSAAPFWLPTDPVLVMEGDRIEPVRRNGPAGKIDIRTQADLVSSLSVTSQGETFHVAAGQLSGLPSVPSEMPDAAVAAALVGEAALLMPIYAAVVAQALADQGGDDNPAVASQADFIAALRAAQGGQSPLTGSKPSGLYATVHAAGYEPAANPVEKVTQPMELSVGFENGAMAYPPNPVAWMAQTALPEFSATRVDPFLPVWLVWRLRLDPLAPGQGSNYAPSLVSDKFELGPDAVDYEYRLQGAGPVAGFTTGNPIVYDGSVVLNTKPTTALTSQIDRYIADFPSDAADAELKTARADFASRRIISQALSGFSLEQTLRAPFPQIEVADLVLGPRDAVTATIASAARADPQDNWYDTAFNSVAPISTGLLAQYNFGPMRSGFLEVLRLEIVDVFGQIMDLKTPQTSTGAMKVVPSSDLQPMAGDLANAEKAYLPPRPLVPSRLDFNWLSAGHNSKVAGISGDFVELNDHPATSPICGWIVPNHLVVALMFYSAAGDPIGSFGVEHGALKYRTRPGNLANPTSDLDKDIGPPGAPTVNEHLADLMRFVSGQDAAFLIDLMATIERSDAFINPASFAESVALSVLIGRPLAIGRARIGMSTLGGVLPVSEANISQTSALAQAVANGWTDYADRQKHTSAAIAGIRFPVRLGDLSNIDDGLVAYLPEAGGAAPYSTVYSPAAPNGGGDHVVQPKAGTLNVTLNGPALTLTLIVDPRAPVHATTGIQPVGRQQIPPDQYSAAMQRIAVSFTTHPVLRSAGGISLPLPEEPGFDWSWVAPRGAATPLPAKAGSDHAVYGYTPQRLLEGWLELTPKADSGGEQ